MPLVRVEGEGHVHGFRLGLPPALEAQGVELEVNETQQLSNSAGAEHTVFVMRVAVPQWMIRRGLLQDRAHAMEYEMVMQKQRQSIAQHTTGDEGAGEGEKTEKSGGKDTGMGIDMGLGGLDASMSMGVNEWQCDWQGFINSAEEKKKVGTLS